MSPCDYKEEQTEVPPWCCSYFIYMRSSGQVYTTSPVRRYILRLTKVIPNILSNHSPGKLSRPGWKVLEV